MPTLDTTHPARSHRRDGRRGLKLPDVRREPVGDSVGRVGPTAPNEAVGTFGNVAHPRRQGAGAFAGDPDRQRQETFGNHDLGHAV